MKIKNIIIAGSIVILLAVATSVLCTRVLPSRFYRIAVMLFAMFNGFIGLIIYNILNEIER